MPQFYVSVEQDYVTLSNEAALAYATNMGRFWIHGKDALDLLNRISTQQLAGLKKNEVSFTVQTTNKGRIIDFLTVANLGDRLLVFTALEAKDSVMDSIEFFSFDEDVKLEDCTAETELYQLFGDEAPTKIISLLQDESHVPDINQAKQISVNNEEVIIIRTDRVKIPTYEILAMNSTCDGANQVKDLLKKNKIRNISIDRPTIGIIGDWLGLKLEGGTTSNKEFMEKYGNLPKEVVQEASEKFGKDPRDTATPQAMAELLQMIWSNKILKKESSELLLDIMGRCQTGEGRLKGLLPAETYVAHKTGTIGATTNDVGIIRLPHNKGNVVVVAFVKDSEFEIPERERAIAHVARAVHDYFIFE